MNRADKLKALAKEHGLTPRDIAQMTGVSLFAARAWLRPQGNKAFRMPPESIVRLVQLQVDHDLLPE